MTPTAATAPDLRKLAEAARDAETNPRWVNVYGHEGAPDGAVGVTDPHPLWDLHTALSPDRVLALLDRLAALEAGSLDEAWARCEAALPEGWHPTVGPWLDDRIPSRDDWLWIASAERVSLIEGARKQPNFRYLETNPYPVDGYGPTPTQALTALAEALEARALAGTPKP